MKAHEDAETHPLYDGLVDIFQINLNKCTMDLGFMLFCSFL